MLSYRKSKNLSYNKQFLISALSVVIVVIFTYFLKELIGYRVVALLLLFTVSVLAMLFDILPVLVASLLSALIWNFMFIPPQFTFHIDNAEDLLMFLMYFIIALLNAVLTSKIREQEKNTRDREEHEKTIKLYNTLFNSLSHELRTPISSIIAAIDTLTENKSKLSETNQATLLNEIDIASLRLNRQVENLLNMSRLESGMLKTRLEWCDLNELINMLVQKYLEISNSHVIEYYPSPSLPYIKTDMMMIEQILSNLIHNGQQHTLPKTVIKIFTDIVDENLQITVEDNGKGFPESSIPLVFDKFYRLPDSVTGGTGLGLSIVKGFVHALNGSVILENVENGGARFIINIPCETTYINNIKNE